MTAGERALIIHRRLEAEQRQRDAERLDEARALARDKQAAAAELRRARSGA